MKASALRHGPHRTPHHRHARRGSILAVALVCLLLAVTLLGLVLQGTLRARRQLLLERDRRQTELLLQAGVERAALRLAQEVDYAGETWAIPADAIQGDGEGRVVIQASRDSQETAWKLRSDRRVSLWQRAFHSPVAQLLRSDFHALAQE